MSAVTTEPTSLDPSKGNSVLDNEIQRVLQEGLVRFMNGNVEPGCAESWDVSDDQTTYTFHLRDGLKWSDGKNVTAQDFLYSFQRLVDPDTAAPYGWIAEAAGILNATDCNSGAKDVSELGVSAPDDKTLVVQLANPTPYFLTLIGNNAQFSLVREDLAKEYGNDFAANAEKNAYTGPYVLASSENQIDTFEKNPNYWNADAVNFDHVEEDIVTDENTALAMYESGELDYVAIPLDQTENYLDAKGHGSYETGVVDYVYMNNASESQSLLQDVNFRKALNYALNRNEYIQLATNNVYEPATTFVSPKVSGSEGGTTYGEECGDQLHVWPADGDQDQAKEYLQKAMDTAGISDPSDITLSFVCTDSESEKRIAEVIQQNLQGNLGITVNIQQVTYAEKYSTVFPEHNFELGYGGCAPDFSDPYTYLDLFRSDNPSNYSNYANDDYDAKLEASLTETDRKTRLQDLCDAENMLLDDAAVIPVQQRTQHYLLNPDYTGIEFGLGSINFDWAFGDVTKS